MAQYYDLNMNNQRIYNCLDPAAAQDVATRNYVDERAVAYTAEGQIQYAGPSPFLPTTLSVGASGDVLTVAGGVPTWAAPTGPLATNGACSFVYGITTTTNTLSGTTGPIVPIQFTSKNISSGICSNFSVNGGDIEYTGTNPVIITMVVPVVFNTTLTAGGVEEFTTVNPINGGLPASGANPPYLNLYTHTGLVFTFGAYTSAGGGYYSATQACASGCLSNIGQYNATLTFTTSMETGNKIAFQMNSNSAFNQNWNGGPNAGAYTITLQLNVAWLYAVECPFPV